METNPMTQDHTPADLTPELNCDGHTSNPVQYPTTITCSQEM